jgi:hypothetical protein
MNESLSVASLDIEDEFRGLGDDLLSQELPEQQEVVAVVLKKRESNIKKTSRQKALRVMLKRAGISRVPPIEQIFAGKNGPKIAISEIGFISKDNQSDPLLAELAQSCPERNRLNRDDILRSQILIVGTEIFKAGRMCTPIHVFHDIHGGGIECISGRHRLAFLAVVYGSDVKVPVYIENLSLKAARESVAVANDSRPIKALERASYAILRAAGGDGEQNQDRLYEKLASHKPNIGKYCVYSVIERGHPAKLTFKLSEKSSRPDGGITTVSNIEEFWGEALLRRKGMSRKEFDVGLLDSVRFLNAFVTAIKKMPEFEPDQHLTANVMTAVGRYYHTFHNVTGRHAIEIVGDLTKGVVSMGQTSKKSLFELYNEIAGHMAVT